MAKSVKASVTEAVDNVDKGEVDDNPVTYYERIISAYEREYQKWTKRSEAIIKRYRDEQRSKQDNDQTKFNILWSNVQTLVPATFSRLPQPDVSRRFRDNDPVGRVSSLLLERALSFEVEHYPDYRSTMRQSVLDRFLPGRGSAWARYEPHFKAAEEGLPTDGVQVTEDVDTPGEQLDYECAPTDYVPWKDFGHNIARTWEEVFVVWRIVYMYEEGVAERFGVEVAESLSYDSTPEEKRRDVSQTDTKKQAKIYEIWDKQRKCAYWIARSGSKEPLDEKPDPLGLKDFFPCPRPLYATISNETLVPVPDFLLYQDQAYALDILADRMVGLIRMLQVKGTYDASTQELARLFTEGVNGTLIPVKNFAAFAEKGGLNGAIFIQDLKPIADALKSAYEAFAEIIGQVYQLTGISDIIRGVTDPNETLGAQEMKGQYAGLRLGDMKMAVAQYATELLQLKAQIICAKFSPQTILAISAADQLSEADRQYIEPALALLIGPERMADPLAEPGPNPLRSFRIEVNADSLVQLDEQAEKEGATELLTGLAGYLKTATEVGAQAPQMVPVMVEVLKWALTKYKVGKTLEGTVDAALDQMKQAAAAPKPPPPPDPKLLVAQAQVKGIEIQTQAEAQVIPIKAQAEVQKAQAGIQKAQIDGQTAVVKGHAAEVKAQADITKAGLGVEQARQAAKAPTGGSDG